MWDDACEEVARHFCAVYAFDEAMNYRIDPDAIQPYYYCQKHRDTYPSSYKHIIPFEPFDWEDLELEVNAA
jgi:hypothetical protein